MRDCRRTPAPGARLIVPVPTPSRDPTDTPADTIRRSPRARYGARFKGSLRGDLPVKLGVCARAAGGAGDDIVRRSGPAIAMAPRLIVEVEAPTAGPLARSSDHRAEQFPDTGGERHR